MKCYVTRNSDYLVHTKGEEREDHKYIKREWKNGKWIYFYPADNIKNPMNKSLTSIFDKDNIKNIGSINTAKKTSSSLFDSIRNGIKSLTDDSKKNCR